VVVVFAGTDRPEASPSPPWHQLAGEAGEHGPQRDDGRETPVGSCPTPSDATVRDSLGYPKYWTMAVLSPIIMNTPQRKAPMPSVRIHIHVAPDHSITGAAPTSVPPGPHEVVLRGPYVTAPTVPFHVADLPADNGPWDDSVSLRREAIYGDAGR
jgi:hypothetical protein